MGVVRFGICFDFSFVNIREIFGKLWFCFGEDSRFGSFKVV